MLARVLSPLLYVACSFNSQKSIYSVHHMLLTEVYTGRASVLGLLHLYVHYAHFSIFILTLAQSGEGRLLNTRWQIIQHRTASKHTHEKKHTLGMFCSIINTY